MPVRPRHAARNRRAASWGHWTVWIWFPLALLLVLAGVCLYRSGAWLVADDAFGRVPWAVILSGESRDGERSDAALKLYLEGRIDTTIVSSVRLFKDRYPGEYTIEHLAREGYPREKLFEFRHDAYSTQEEAALLIRQFRFQGLDTVLIITSNFHSARTRRIFRALSRGYPHILVHAADFKDYDPSAWWSGRESAKYWLTEWMKTVSTFFELLNSPPETGKSETDGLMGGAGGGYGQPGDSLPSAGWPVDSPARGDTVPDATALPGDTGALVPDLPGPDSLRAGEAGGSPGAQTGDSAVAEASSGKAPAAEEGATQPKAGATAKSVPSGREAARKEAKETSKEGASAKSAAAKPASKPATKAGGKPEAKTSGKKAASKPSEKDKEKKSSR